MNDRESLLFQSEIMSFVGYLMCHEIKEFKSEEIDSLGMTEIILPESINMNSGVENRDLPQFFLLTNPENDFHIHCQRSKIKGEEGKVFLRNWMLSYLKIISGKSLVFVQDVSLEDYFSRPIGSEPMDLFGDASMAAEMWVEAHPNVSLIYSDESEQRMYFLMNTLTEQSGGNVSFDIQLQTGDRITWIVNSGCDNSFIEKANLMCAKYNNITIENLLDCINYEKQKMPSSGNMCDCEEGRDEKYMAADDDFTEEDYCKNEYETLRKSSEPLYSDEDFVCFAWDRCMIKRLLADMKSLNSSGGKFGVSGCPRDDNLVTWDVRLTDFEPESRLAQDLLTYSKKFGREACINLEVKFLDTYPGTPPFVRVSRPRFKYPTGHVTVGGSVAMENLMLSRWSPSSDFEGILIQIRSEIMSDPNARLELDRDLEYTEAEAKDAFERMVAKYRWG